jgi:F0F1-type ATP synthase assembly protein I
VPDTRVSVDRGALEAMQSTLDRGEPTIVASYALIGAILLFGGCGFAADRYLGASPWCLLGGLLLGIVVGFYQLIRVVHHSGAADLAPIADAAPSRPPGITGPRV